MEENILRTSRRMLRLDLETEITPPLSPHDLSSTDQMTKYLHSDIESFPPFESEVEGVVETLEEVYL